MIESLLLIPEKCMVQNKILVSKFFDDDYFESVRSITWLASLKPLFVNVTAVKTETIRYEEIQIICVDLTETDNLYGVANAFYKKIKYPCLLVMRYNNKFLFSTCQFDAGKDDYNSNKLHSIQFSHWIYPDLLSDGAKRTINKINNALNLESDLKTIYTELSHAVQFFRLEGTTKAHVKRLLYDMIGPTSDNKLDNIMQYATPYKKHHLTEQTLAAKYDKSKRTKSFTYSYDYEDIWYCLQKYEPSKRVIEGRRYRDIEDLMNSIDTKLSGGGKRWK